ncbi:hypothetical protein [Cytophaga aurantiaca]|uniref:hypothetical protein n=1 Tax=Cytophaga aurantiaca TaxID=29530 RepID=UPI00035E545B|nr:hypothetical protein [Cytophaga aurantiaca]
MNKFFWLCYALLSFYPCTYAQTQLQPGDVAVIGYNFKDPDQFSFIFLKNVAAGTILHITDSGYDAATSAFRVGEGYLIYTVPAGGKRAGEIVTFPDDLGFVTKGVSGFFGLSADGDQLIFFQGTFLAPVFIYALTVSDDNWTNSPITNNNTNLPPGLTNGISALRQTKIVNSRLNCTGVAIDKSLFLTQITDEARWDRSSATRVTLPDITCDYTPLSIDVDVLQIEEVDSKRVIASGGYTQIDVLGADGFYYFSTDSLDEALRAINREKMYIFKVYYPDRLEVQKVILE